jgi:hypothetical protein
MARSSESVKCTAVLDTLGHSKKLTSAQSVAPARNEPPPFFRTINYAMTPWTHLESKNLARPISSRTCEPIVTTGTNVQIASALTMRATSKFSRT